jgi:hypothetical protein
MMVKKKKLLPLVQQIYNCCAKIHNAYLIVQIVKIKFALSGEHEAINRRLETRRDQKPFSKPQKISHNFPLHSCSCGSDIGKEEYFHFLVPKTNFVFGCQIVRVELFFSLSFDEEIESADERRKSFEVFSFCENICATRIVTIVLFFVVITSVL